jgi:hypothetical protein
MESQGWRKVFGRAMGFPATSAYERRPTGRTATAPGSGESTTDALPASAERCRSVIVAVLAPRNSTHFSP